MNTFTLLKQGILLLVGIFCLNSFVLGQVEITLKPGAEGKDATVFSKSANIDDNFGEHRALYSTVWSWNGEVGIKRSLIQFDLSSLPSNAQIVDARLSLFGISGIDLPHKYYDKPNTFVIQRITADWSEMAVTWNTQPTTTDLNQVVLGPTVFEGQDFTVIDVRALIQDMVDNTNYGFMIKLETEEKYKSVAFHSSDSEDETKHPQLYVKYITEPETAPADPSELTFSYTEGTGVELQWVDNATDEARYIVERSTVTNSTYTQIANLSANSTSHTDNTTTSPGKYYYRVKAESTSGVYGNYSNEEMIMIDAITISNTNDTVCNVYYYDDGFQGELLNMKNYTHTIYPSEAGKILTMAFDTFSLPIDYSLKIYHGTSTSNELIGTYTGSSLPQNLQSMDVTGALTIVQTANASHDLKAGWRAFITCVDSVQRPEITGLTATSSSVEVHWTNPIEPTFSVISRSKEGGAYEILDTVYAVTQFTDENVSTGTIYSYRLKNNKDGLYSTWSSASQVQTAGPTAPALLTIDTVGADFITLNWTDNSDNETGFVVKRSGYAFEGFTPISAVDANTTSYTDSDLQSDTVYYYRIAAYDASDTSDASNMVNTLTNSVNLFNSSGYSRCDYYLLDPGGLSDYSNNANVSMLLKPASINQQIKLSFEDFNLENGYDYLKIYDSTSLVGSYTGNSTPPSAVGYNEEGSLKLEFTSDFAATSTGFKIYVGCIEVPLPPQNVTADTVTKQKVTINWHDMSDIETGVIVERSEISDEQFTAVDTVDQNITTFTDSNILVGNTYFYRLAAYNQDGNSMYSDTAEAHVPGPAIPAGFAIDTVGNSFVNLVWSHEPTVESGYILERSGYADSAFAAIAEIDVALNEYLDAGLSFDSVYYYRIRSYDSEDTSRYSQTLAAAPGSVTMFTHDSYIRCGYVLRDPGGLDNYWNNALVSMTLSPPQEGQEIQLVFDMFETENIYDKLKIYDDIYLIEQLSGNEYPEEIHSTTSSGELTLEFESDGSTNHRGFKIYVNCIDVPASPTAFTIDNITDKQAVLNWLDMSDNETGFIIQRSDDTFGNYIAIDSIPADSETYTDTLLQTGTSYYYRVFAYNNDGNSFHTNELQIATLGSAAPENLTAVNNEGIVTLTWDDASDNETSFIIEKSVNDEQNYADWKVMEADTEMAYDTVSGEKAVIYYRIRSTDGTYTSNALSVAYTYSNTVPMSSISYNSCGFYLMDKNGMEDYSNNESETMVLHPVDTNHVIKLHFLEFETEDSWDELKVYDGALSSQALIGTYSGNQVPSDIVATNENGSLVLEFASDISNVSSGFLIDVSCIERPQVPVNIAALSAQNEVTISWNANTDETTGYLIYCSENGNAFELKDSVDASQHTYVDDSLLPEKQYRYYIEACKNGIHSHSSEMIELVAAGILPPAALSAESWSQYQITLSWSDISSVEKGYVIERANFKDKVFQVIDSVETDVQVFVDENVEIKTKYLYRVTGFNDDYQSQVTDSVAIWTNMVPVKGYVTYTGLDNAVLVDNGFLNNYDNSYSHYAKAEPFEGMHYQIEFISIDTEKDVDILKISSGYMDEWTFSGSELPEKLTSTSDDGSFEFEWDPRTEMQHAGFEIFIKQVDLTAVSSVNHDVDMKMYPNPCNNNVYLSANMESETEATIEITNIAGQVLYLENQFLSAGKNEYKIDMQKFETGIYFCKISVDGKESVFRLSKE